MTKVKICGVNSADAMDAVVESGADWLGFVFFARSPRCVTAQAAASLAARHDGGPLRVGLFVAPHDDDIARVLDVVSLDILQLYAPAPRVAELRGRFGLPVWRGVGVSVAGDLPHHTDGADALLIEAKPPKNATRPGGNAVRFDWDILAGWRPGFDWLLAGGLTLTNVAEAVTRSGAPAVDLSSGVESAPGVKDPALIRAFVLAAKRLGA
jgi:phosphoribosylanthranilate isomerase